MCLTLKSEKTRVKTAKSDIVVYKELKMHKKEKDASSLPFINGEEFSGVINKRDCEGKISIEHNSIYFCTNNKDLDGNPCSDKQGYKHSWQLDDVVGLIKTSTHELTDEDLFTSIIATPYRNFAVEEGEIYNSVLRKVYDSIEEGLHTFKSKPTSSIWAECIIPKGSKYYVGEFSIEVSYVSDTLKYIKIHEE
jgi:hypothetical protein